MYKKSSSRNAVKLGLLSIIFCASLLMYAPRAKACCSCFATFMTEQIVGVIPGFAAGPLASMLLKIGNLSDEIYLPTSPSIPLPAPPPLYTPVPGGIIGHRDWIKQVLWDGKEPILAKVNAPTFQYGIKNALKEMTQQFKSVAMLQSLAFGSFLDAKHQMETQQILQTIRANTHKNYQTSVGVCEFGSSVKTLAASEEKSYTNARILSNIAQKRALHNAYTPSEKREYLLARIDQYKKNFCNPKDLNNGLEYLCQHDYTNMSIKSGEKIGAQNPDRMNKDIDYTRTIDTPWTLNIDFSDNKRTYHEEEVLALSANLYNSVPLNVISAKSLQNYMNSNFSKKQSIYMDMRSLRAKESVAENSFNAITSMKSAGAPGSKDFLIAVMEPLLSGSNKAETAARIISDDPDQPSPDNQVEPSYYAQMEILTKKMVQNPDFYTNLYDKPANVLRKRVGLQAIGLMQKFDLFKSHLRNEANLSLLLELHVGAMQSNAEGELKRQGLSSTGLTAPGIGVP